MKIFKLNLIVENKNINPYNKCWIILSHKINLVRCVIFLNICILKQTFKGNLK